MNIWYVNIRLLYISYWYNINYLHTKICFIEFNKWNAISNKQNKISKFILFNNQTIKFPFYLH